MTKISNSFKDQQSVKLETSPRFFRLYKAGFEIFCMDKYIPFEIFVCAESEERALELVTNHQRFKNNEDAYFRYLTEIKIENYFNKVLN